MPVIFLVTVPIDPKNPLSQGFSISVPSEKKKLFFFFSVFSLQNLEIFGRKEERGESMNFGILVPEMESSSSSPSISLSPITFPLSLPNYSPSPPPLTPLPYLLLMDLLLFELKNGAKIRDTLQYFKTLPSDAKYDSDFSVKEWGCWRGCVRWWRGSFVRSYQMF